MPTVNLGIATETNTAHSILPANPAAFAFPQQWGFNALSILRPHWKLYFFAPGTDDEEPVFSDPALSNAHSQPVTLDRSAQMPEIYIDRSNAYAISVRDEFGNERHKIDYFAYPQATKKVVALGMTTESNLANAFTVG